MLFLDDSIALDDLLLTLLQLLLHLLDLRLIDGVCINELRTLFLQRCNQALRLLNQRLLVLHLALERLNEDHLLRDGLLLRVLCLIERLIPLS